MAMIIRNARREDLADAMRVIECGRHYMRTCGNYIQWINGYPTEEQILKEIDKGQFFVWEETPETDGASAVGEYDRKRKAEFRSEHCESCKTAECGERVNTEELCKSLEIGEYSEGKIHGVFSFILDTDPTYDYVENGKWLNNQPYGTIHRMASDGSRGGFFKEALDFCMARVDNIRMDTHEVNGHMRRLAEANGFKECGVIYVADGTPRVAYQLVVRPPQPPTE